MTKAMRVSSLLLEALKLRGVPALAGSLVTVVMTQMTVALETGL
jgi:hypothetical protein